jgi:hypothetical protein
MIADRKHECAFFDRLLAGNEKPILIIEGPSETGKSTLLAELAERADAFCGQGFCVRLDLKGSLPIRDVISRILEDLDQVLVQAARKTYATAVATLKVEMERIHVGEGGQLNMNPIINMNGAGDHQDEGVLFSALRLTRAPLAIIIDTYEAATNESATWICQRLLAAVRNSPRLRVVIGGQKAPLPQHHAVAWGARASHHLLEPVQSVDDWYDFARHQHRDFPRRNIEALHQGNLTSRPGVMNTYIMTVAAGLAAQTNGRSS